MLLIVVFFAAYAERFAFANEDWGYMKGQGELDPKHWYTKYQNCIGNRQSPIDIEKTYVVSDPNLKPLMFIGYDKRITVNVTNEGHTVRVDIPDSAGAHLTSKSLNTTYKLKQFHFHWGHTDNVGSEHRLYGQRFPLEMHMVHADEKVTYDKALGEPFGLLVVSVLFNFGKENPELKRITDHFKDIADPLKKTVTTIANVDLIKLLPINTRNYLQYAGSLTTPPCNEAVQWIVLPLHGEISHAQMTNFRSLKHEVLVNGKIVEEQFENNDRNVQAIKGRKVHQATV